MTRVARAFPIPLQRFVLPIALLLAADRTGAG